MTEAETAEYRKYIEIQTKYMGKTAGEAALEFLTRRSREVNRQAASPQTLSSSLGTPTDTSQRGTPVTRGTDDQGVSRREHAEADSKATPFPWPHPAQAVRPHSSRMSQTPGFDPPRTAQKPALEAIVHAYTRKHFPERSSPAWDAWYTPPARLTPESNRRLHRKQALDR